MLSCVLMPSHKTWFTLNCDALVPCCSLSSERLHVLSVTIKYIHLEVKSKLPVGKHIRFICSVLVFLIRVLSRSTAGIVISSCTDIKGVGSLALSPECSCCLSLTAGSPVFLLSEELVCQRTEHEQSSTFTEPLP